MSVVPLSTPRLTLRMLRPTDAARLATYRDDPETAHFQDWVLPYTVEQAVDLASGQLDLDDVTSGRWIQLAIDHVDGDDGSVTMVGDVGIGLDDAGRVASIGYTLAPGWRGRGLAREAVAAVVDALFAHLEVHRIVATLDPDNAASERLLVALGFVREGVLRQSIEVRGEWVDDLVYSLLRSDRFGVGSS
jgi:RimJ/RimL family protein N-acetyltransferase